MRLLIIDLYGDGESLRVCEDKADIDQIIAEFVTDEGSDEPFDEFMARKGVQLFLTRRQSLEHAPGIFGSTADERSERRRYGRALHHL